MLSINPIKSSKSAADYYLQAFNYYASDATAIQWLGNGSQIMKLPTTVHKEQLLDLLEGKLPDGKSLQNMQGEHRPGFDMTFSAPKSVSILVGLGVAPELVEFHDEAVKLTIQQIEKEFAQTRVARQGEISFEKTNNLLVATFRQPSSRSNDPALHTHCVTMNITFHEGKARSLASDPSRENGVIEQIQNNAHYCGLIYRQHLANMLKDAHYSLRSTGDGLFEIDGIPDKVLQEFSTRRADIVEYMDDKGWSGAKSASAATLLTRNAKGEHDLNILRQDWQVRAKDLSFDAKAFMQNKHNPQAISWFSDLKDKLLSLVNSYKKDSSHSKLDAACACVQVAIETLSQKTSVFSKRMLTQEAMKHSLIYPKAVSQQIILKAIEQEINRENLYEEKSYDNEKNLLTTPWLLTLEAETIARIEQNQGVMPAIASLQTVKAFQKERRAFLAYPMTNSQKKAMQVLLTNKDRYLAIQGYAGVAKTSMLAEAKTLIETKGYNLRGITVASSASHELQEKAGIKSDVFPLVHQELKNSPTASLAKTIFIVDEASMLSSHQGHELLKQIERVGARLILVGDKAQLPSVNAGRIFGLTQENGMKTTVMDEIVRQKNTKLKEAVLEATKGNITKALDNLNIKMLETHEKRIEWIASHWLSLSAKERDETLLFAPTNNNRIEITAIIREALKKEGSLHGDSFNQIIFKPKNMEAVQRRFVSYYQNGEILRFNKNFNANNIKANSYFTVGDISKKHRKDNVLPLIDENNKLTKINLNNLPVYKTHTAPFERIIEGYESKTLELLVGDKVMWTRNFGSEGIRNGQCATIQEIKEDKIIFKMNDNKIISFEKSHPALKHLDYSYVLTNYKVQGKDAPNGIGLMESFNRFSTNLNNFYVQISRAIHGMTLVTDNKENLIAAIKKNSKEKLAAIDHISSDQLLKHTQRFETQNTLSIQALIDKKHALEGAGIAADIQKKSNIDEVILKNTAYSQKQFTKELEI